MTLISVTAKLRFVLWMTISLEWGWACGMAAFWVAVLQGVHHLDEGRAEICILPCFFVLTNKSGGQGDLPDWCSSTDIPLIPQNSHKVARKKPVVSKLSFLSSGSFTENNVVMANGKVLKTSTMGLGTEKMLGSYIPSDERASVTCQLLVCIWYHIFVGIY